MLVPIVCASRIKAAKSVVHNQGFMVVVLFELFFFLPLGAFLYFFYPDWSLMYFYDPASLSVRAKVWLGIGALSGYMAAAVAGFMLSATLVRRDQDKTAILVMAGLAAAVGIFCAFTVRQIVQVGTFADWNALPRTTTALHLHRIGYVISTDVAGAGLVLTLVLRSLRRERAL